MHSCYFRSSNESLYLSQLGGLNCLPQTGFEHPVFGMGGERQYHYTTRQVESLVNLEEKNINLCKSAAGEMDQLKSEKIADKTKLLEIHEGQESVQEGVITEMKGWADNIKKSQAGCQISS